MNNIFTNLISHLKNTYNCRLKFIEWMVLKIYFKLCFINIYDKIQVIFFPIFYIWIPLNHELIIIANTLIE